MKRKMYVNGSFYPNTCEQLLPFFDANKSQAVAFTPQILISPHAGYIYSGECANIGFATVAKVRTNIENIIVIGPSHRVRFEGASIALHSTYDTPSKELNINVELSHTLKEKFQWLNFYDEVHQEHSTETQMPFIANYFASAKIIEIIYGALDYRELSNCIDMLLDEKNLIVISSDLSHFYTQEKASILDEICINSIQNLDIDGFDKGCEACGLIGIKASILSATKHNLSSKILSYTTSDKTNADTSSVVGYLCSIIG